MESLEIIRIEERAVSGTSKKDIVITLGTPMGVGDFAGYIAKIYREVTKLDVEFGSISTYYRNTLPPGELDYGIGVSKFNPDYVAMGSSKASNTHTLRWHSAHPDIRREMQNALNKLCRKQ